MEEKENQATGEHVFQTLYRITVRFFIMKDKWGSMDVYARSLLGYNT